MRTSYTARVPPVKVLVRCRPARQTVLSSRGQDLNL
jgi:hypothetical protein